VRSAYDPDVLARVPPGTGAVHRRLADEVVRLVGAGVLHPGQRLPSSRVLAARLGVARGVVLAAYTELHAVGYLQGRHGSGTYLAEDVPAGAGPGVRAAPPARRSSGARRDEPAAGQRRDSYPPAGEDLTPGHPETSALPGPAWRRAWRAAGAARPSGMVGPAGGEPPLRGALAEHLRRARGLAVHPDEVVVVPGTDAAVRTLGAALSAAGGVPGPGGAVPGPGGAGAGWTAVVEDPGYPAVRTALVGCGARLVPVPVDGDGLRVELLPAGAALAYVTPSHQYPLGGRLGAGRRGALLAWARRTGALVVEDDYDSEFRFDAGPLPALATLDPGRGSVAYLGTLSKVLAPGLRLAYLLPPPALLEPVLAVLERSRELVAEPVQHAVTALLSDGAVAGHVSRVRRRYAARRSALVRHLEPLVAAGLLTVHGLDAGLHVVLEPHAGPGEADVAAALAARGLHVDTLARFRVGGPGSEECPAGRDGVRGLVVGYARADEATLARLAAALAEILGGGPAATLRGGSSTAGRAPRRAAAR